MGRFKKLTLEEARDGRVRLYEQLEAGELDIPSAVRAMRRLTGMTQDEYARRVAGVSVNTLKAIEQGRANPRVSTLQRVGRAFGLGVGFVRKR